MEFKDIKHSSLIKYLYTQNKGLEYKGYVFGYGPRNNSTGEDSVSFFNKDVGEYIDVTPIADGKINQEIYNTNFIEDAVSKSEDQKTLNKRIEKIFLSYYKEIIDDAVNEITKQKPEPTNDFESVSEMSNSERNKLLKFLIGKQVNVSVNSQGNETQDIGVGRIIRTYIDESPSEEKNIGIDVELKNKIYYFLINNDDVDKFVYSTEVGTEDEESGLFDIQLLTPYTKQKEWYVVEDNGVYDVIELNKNSESEDGVEHYVVKGPFEKEHEAQNALIKITDNLQENKQKFNNKEYKYYIISKGRILSGWEFKEDARDALKELPPVRRSESRVVSKRDMTIDVSDDGNWGDDDIDESEIIRNAREEFEFDAKSRFRDSGTENLILEIRAVDNKIVMDWYLKEISKKMSEAIGMGLNGVYNALNTKHQHAFEVFLAMKKPGKTNPLTPKIEKVLPDYLIKIWFLDHENNKKRTGEKFVGYIDANSMSEDKQTREVSFHVYGENTTMDGDVIDSEIMLSMTGKQFKDLTENGNSIAEDPNAEQMAEIFIVKKGEFKKRVKK